MSEPHATPIQSLPRSAAASEGALSTRWAAAARAFIVGAMLLAATLFVAGIPVFFARVGNVCSGDACPTWQMDPIGLQALQRLHLSINTFAVWATVLDALFILSFWTVGVLLLRYRSDDRVALFSAFTLITFGMSFSNTLRALQTSPSAWAVPLHILTFFGGASLLVFFYVFPTGRFVPGWTRWTTVIWLAGQLLFQLFPSDVGGWLFAVVMLITGVVAQIYRYRRVSSGEQRRQTKWVVYGLTVAVIALALIGAALIAFAAQAHPLDSPVGSQVYLLLGFNVWRVTFLLVPLAIGIAILRSQLFDVDVIINRTLVYAGLSVLVVGMYILIVLGIGTLLQLGSNLVLSLVATALVAVLFQPVKDRLQRATTRLLYGERGDPYAVLSRLGQQLESTLRPDAVLPTIVRMVTEALKLPYAAIELWNGNGFAVAAAAGSPVASPVTVPLVYGTETVGRLLLGPRGPRETFGSADTRLFADLARQIGVAAHAVQLTADLQRSRERLVTAREEERRRLRRDLHDGLGPMLGSLTLKLDVAHALVDRDPAGAHTLLTDLKKQTQTAIADIRRLVYALRPPALDDLGLVGAIRQSAGQYSHNGQESLEISVEAPQALSPLPAAVEVAILRITQEALTNVVRHSGARHCRVTLALQQERNELMLEVSDDGRGMPADRRAGVGLRSMTERADELGGTCSISTGFAGTTIRVRLPCSLGGDSG